LVLDLLGRRKGRKGRKGELTIVEGRVADLHGVGKHRGWWGWAVVDVEDERELWPGDRTYSRSVDNFEWGQVDDC
jgi:hypothetical protein